MQKRKIIELVQHRLKVIDESGKYPYQVVEGYMNTIYPVFVDACHQRNDIYQLDNLTKRYDGVSISLDSINDRYYSTLPNIVVNARYGVRRITQPKAQHNQFSPCTEQELMYMNGLNVDLLDTTVLYSTKQDRVDYYGMTTDIVEDGVSMYLIVPFETYGENDDINIPDGRLGEFVEMTVRFAKDGEIVDLVNNNSEQ